MKYDIPRIINTVCLLLAVSTILVGCGNNRDESSFAYVADDPSQMPDIVFFDIIDYKASAPDGEYESAMTFYDKNGNHYVTDAAYGSYICGLKYEELISEYAAGNLDDKITLHTSCDVNELFENSRKGSRWKL